MCERFTQHYAWKDIHDLYGLPARNPPVEMRSRYKICPTEPKHSQPCGLTASSISSKGSPRKPPAARSRQHRPPRGLRAASLDEDRLAGPGRARRTPVIELDRETALVREPWPCCAAADDIYGASCHDAGTRRETISATIDPASRIASRLTDIADQVPPNAPARRPLRCQQQEGWRLIRLALYSPRLSVF